MGEPAGRKPTVSDEEILKVFQNASDPVLTASEVADKFSIGRRGILKRLDNLEDEGILISKKIGGRRTVWWYPGYTSTSKIHDYR